MTSPDTTPTRAIVLIICGMAAISVNDVLIKLLAGDYPLHQMVFTRACIALAMSFVFLWAEGGWHLLKTDRPGLHVIRAVLIVIANSLFFAGLAVMPLGVVTALFFVAPLFITVLAIPVLGESVGRHRIVALLIGFAGVVVMMGPGTDWNQIAPSAMLLPIGAAACYAGMQVMTRKLGAGSAASAMAIYIQGAFITISVIFFVTVGDGRFADQVEAESLRFLLRPWVWPATDDIWKFVLMGAASCIVAYCLSQAYRIGSAATVASYEYVALPMAIIAGWIVFAERPGGVMLLGALLIAGGGLYVFARERRKAGDGPAAERPLRRG
jgi:S-adenosylmethionine uptake transporter